MSDKELVARCIERDPIAWNEFVRRYSGLIYWAIENRLKKWDYLYQPADIEEIHQNVFIGLWNKNKLQQLEDQQKISAWLVMVSGNEAINYFRREKSQTPPNAISIFEEIIQKDGIITIADILHSRRKNPYEEIKTSEIENILEDEIKRLPSTEKLILKLNVLYNKKYREIAEMLNMPVGSVSTALKNIKIRLRKRLHDFF